MRFVHRASSLGVLAAGLFVVGVGCAEPGQRVIAVPAARDQGDGRPLRLLPPFELATSDDAVVRIVTDVTCTGTLVADDLVLTAHHCVSARDAEGRVAQHDVTPAEVTIELGGDYLPWGEVSVRAIVTPDCGYASGDGDIALLVLSRRLIGIPTMAPRLESGPNKTEAFAIMGFGRCALSGRAIKRATRETSAVSLVRSRQFLAPAAICPGDSGGPAIMGGGSSGGEVVGIVSASVMDGDETTPGASVFTRLDVWRNLFGAAREIANGASPSELPPFRSCVP
jgi:hypothetical protein